MDIQFFGAAQEVTGSCFLVRAGAHRVLVDCGLIQGSYEDEARNRVPFPFEPGEIDAVILTHAHLDHSGRLPLLVKAGFRGPIYTHRASRDLCRIMLKDAAFLNEKDAEWENRKRERKGLAPVAPLYTVAEVEQAMRRFKTLDYDIEQDILPGVRMRLLDAGHMLGSAILELWLGGDGGRRKLVFSGDLGHRGAPILRDPQTVREADLVVMESTYGDRNHRSWDATWAELAQVLDAADGDKGNILIPAFAVGRSQELLYIFARHWREWKLDRWAIFLDSPMAIRATEVYARYWELYDAEAARTQRTRGTPFELPNLYYSSTANQSMRINRMRAGAIIIAGSGMCTGGRIRHHLKHHVWREHCHVLFVGFQARGTLGRALVDGAKEINLWGETIRVAAQIHTIGGLSAHADRDGLLQWYRYFEGRPPVALVHGEPTAIDGLRQRLQQDFKTRVSVPEPGARIDLTSL